MVYLCECLEQTDNDVPSLIFQGVAKFEDSLKAIIMTCCMEEQVYLRLQGKNIWLLNELMNDYPYSLLSLFIHTWT